MTACERAQQWISLELDGELSELELAALGRHLETCASCRAVRARVGGFTWMLRDEPLLELQRPVVVAAPFRSRAKLARRGGAVLAFAAAVGVLAAAVVLPGSGGSMTSALAFNSVAEQKRFAQIEHVRAEPETFLVVYVSPAVPSFAARALS